MEIKRGGGGHVDEATKCLGCVIAPDSVSHYIRIVSMLIGGGMSVTDALLTTGKVMR